MWAKTQKHSTKRRIEHKINQLNFYRYYLSIFFRGVVVGFFRCLHSFHVYVVSICYKVIEDGLSYSSDSWSFRDCIAVINVEFQCCATAGWAHRMNDVCVSQPNKNHVNIKMKSVGFSFIFYHKNALNSNMEWSKKWTTTCH